MGLEAIRLDPPVRAQDSFVAASLMSSLPRVKPFLIAVFVVAAVLLRSYDLTYGLPSIYDPDEHAFVQVAIGMLRDRDPNPHKFSHPAATTVYGLAAVYGATYAVGRGLEWFRSPADFVALYRSDPTVLYVSGRLVTALAGLVTLWLVFRIAARLFGSSTAWIAAAIVMFSPLHARLSQQIRPDVPMALFALVVFWFSLNVLTRGRWRDYVSAGLSLGVAVVTKHPAVVFAAVIALAHVLRARMIPWGFRRLIAAGAACVAACVLVAPFLVLDFRSAVADIMFEARPMHLSATGDGLLPNVAWYVGRALRGALGAPAVFLAGCGTILCARSRERERWLLIAAPMLFLVFISLLSLRWVRWAVPLVPFLAILAAHGTVRTADWVGRRTHLRAGMVVGILLTSVTLLPMAVVGGREITEARGTDTRMEAAHWMLANLPEGSRILMEQGGPQLPKQAFSFHYVNAEGQLVALDLDAHRHATYRPLAGWSAPLALLRGTDAVVGAGIEYVVMSGFYDRYLAESERYPAEGGVYATLLSAGDLVYSTAAVPWRNRGPRVRIVRLTTVGSLGIDAW